jgi:hypothetical protein
MVTRRSLFGGWGLLACIALACSSLFAAPAFASGGAPGYSSVYEVAPSDAFVTIQIAPSVFRAVGRHTGADARPGALSLTNASFVRFAASPLRRPEVRSARLGGFVARA